MSGRIRVAVLAGGRSSEHDISVASARSVIAALDPDRYETVVVEIDRTGRWELASGRGEIVGSDIETLPVLADSRPAAALDQATHNSCSATGAKASAPGSSVPSSRVGSSGPRGWYRPSGKRHRASASCTTPLNSSDRIPAR